MLHHCFDPPCTFLWPKEDYDSPHFDKTICGFRSLLQRKRYAYFHQSTIIWDHISGNYDSISNGYNRIFINRISWNLFNLETGNIFLGHMDSECDWDFYSLQIYWNTFYSNFKLCFRHFIFYA